MPLEQANGELVDERADVYAIGAILYEVLGGRPPYEGTTAHDILAKLIRDVPTPLRQVAPEIPLELVAIVDRAMARSPAQRYASAGELADDLRRYQTGQLVASHTYSTGDLLRRWVRRHRRILLVAGIATIALLAGGVYSYLRVASERDQAEQRQRETEAARLTAERAQASMLLDRARAIIVEGNPARAAPLLAAAQDLGATEAYIPALEAQVAAALPVPRWNRAVGGEVTTISFAGEVVLAGAHVFALKDGSDAEHAIAAPPPLAALIAGTGVPAVTRSALDPTGQVLAIATKEALMVWDVQPMHQRATIRCNNATGVMAETIEQIASVSPAGVVVAVCGWAAQQRLIVWDPRRSELDSLVKSGAFASIGTSRDARVIVDVDDGTARVFRDLRPLAIGIVDAATVAAVSLDGRLVAAGGVSGHVQIWDVETGRELAIMSISGPVTALAFSPDGGTLVAADAHGLTAWSTITLATPVVVGEVNDSTWFTGLRHTPDGARWASVAPKEIIELDEDGHRVGSIPAAPGAMFFATGVAVGGGGLIAATVHRSDDSFDGSYSALLARAGKLTTIELPGLHHTGAIALSADDRWAFSANQLIDVAAGRITGEALDRDSDLARCVVPRPDRAVCAATGFSNAAVILALPSGKLVAEPRPGGSRPTFGEFMTFAATASSVYLGGCPREITVASLDTGATTTTIPITRSACVMQIAVSDAARLGAAVLGGGDVIVWDLATNHVVGELAHTREVSDLVFSPDGAYLAIATIDGRLEIRDAQSRIVVGAAVLRGDATRPRLAFGATSDRLLAMAGADPDPMLADLRRSMWRIPWIPAPGTPGHAWRDRSVFVRNGLEVSLRP
jgi:WD40 repeat protein